MEFHDLPWWEEQLGLDKAGRAQLEEDLQTVKKKFPKPDELHTEEQIKQECAELLDAKGKAWKKIFDALGVGDSLDGFARMESFIGGVFSSELAPGLEGCLYAGGMSVGVHSGLMWKVMDSYGGHGYISSTEAGQLFNDAGFKGALGKRFQHLGQQLEQGKWKNASPLDALMGVSSNVLRNVSGNVVHDSAGNTVRGLNDYFSERFVSSLRCPDVETFFMGDPVDVVYGDDGSIVSESVKVSMRTELRALLKNEHVKTVNGVGKGLIAAVYEHIPKSAGEAEVARRMANFINVTAMNRAVSQYVKWKLNDAGAPTDEGAWEFTTGADPDAVRFMDIYASGESAARPGDVLAPDFADAYGMLDEPGIGAADRAGVREMIDQSGLQWRATMLADHGRVVKLNGGKPLERSCAMMNDAGEIVSTKLNIGEHGVTEVISGKEVSLKDQKACILDDGRVKYIDKNSAAVSHTRFSISMEDMSNLPGEGEIRERCKNFDSMSSSDKLLARIGSDALDKRGISVNKDSLSAKDLTKFAENGIADGTKLGSEDLVCHFDKNGKLTSVARKGEAIEKGAVLSIDLSDVREFGDAKSYTSQLKDYDKLTGLNKLRAQRGVLALKKRGLSVAPGTDAIDLTMVGETCESKNAGKTYHGVFDTEGRFRGMNMPESSETGLFKADIADALGANDKWINDNIPEGKKLTGISRLRVSNAIGTIQRAGYEVQVRDAGKLEEIGKALENPDDTKHLVFDDQERLVDIDSGKELDKGMKRYSTADVVHASGVSDAELKESFGERGSIAFGAEPGSMTTAQAKRWCVKKNNFMRAIDVNNLPEKELKEFCESYDSNRVQWGFGKQLPPSSKILETGGLKSADRFVISLGKHIGDSKIMQGLNSLSESIGGTKCWRRIAAVGKPIGKLFGAGGMILMAADAVKTINDFRDMWNKGDRKGAASVALDYGLSWAGGVIGMRYGAELGCAIGGPAGCVIGMLVGGAIGVGAAYVSQKISPVIVDFLFPNWNDAKNAKYDPLVIDLDGRGFDITDRKNGTHFDLNADGYAEKTDWTRTDGWLALDLNGNGKIDDGSELFGDHTKLADGSLAADGFAALSRYDANGDGVIDARDEIFSQLRIWCDADGDGQSGNGELVSLAEAGVSSISLKTEKPTESGAGEAEISGTAQVVFADGTSKTIGELWAKANMYDTIEMDDGTAGSTARLLNYTTNNHGTLPSLARAVAGEHGDIILADLQAFTSETDILKRFSIVDDMLYTMAGARDVQQDAFGRYINARHLMVDEAFMGEKFQGQWGRNPNPTAGPQLENLYKNIRDSYCFSLMSQIPGNEMFSGAIINRDENGKASVDLGALEFLVIAASLKGELKESTVKDVAAYVAYLSTAIAHDASVFVGFHGMVASQLPDMSKAVEDGVASSAICGSDIADTLTGDGVHQLMFGRDGNDTMNAGSIDGALFGGAGDDRLTGSWASDTLVGGLGDDRLDGGSGADVYVFGLGDGHDVVENYDSEWKQDVIRFSQGVLPSMVSLSRSGDDVVFRVGESDSLTLRGAYRDSWRYVGRVEFADGTVWTPESMRDMIVTRVDGTDGDDELAGYSGGFNFNGVETLSGGAGDDRLTGSWASDTLVGGLGDDALAGNSGDDTLIGGEGNDTLEGGYGNDSYIFNAGFGTDKISDSEGSNSITFHDYQVRDLSAQRDGDNLNLAFTKTGDSVTVNDYYRGSSYNNFSYSFDDGTKLSNDDVASIMNGTYAYADVQQQTDQLAQQLAAPAADTTASDTSSTAVSESTVAQDATSQLWVAKQ
ncbi:calcium-binding protein [Bifidobacterium thermacidophilum]|uniref:calcium-binding protein n=1 Tax=Bifidobacterium thermacidophilum TaxID=246618 RepID=UPI0026EE9A6B|nr:calcium-binding protein [Bifidobacterium thermacidophilum]